jgi:FAD/FMN-containing dehydrogenase
LNRSFENWGRTGKPPMWAVAPRDLPPSPAPGSTFLPFGNGRSYGDSCHNGAGTLIDSRDDDAVIDFDAAAGTITCEAGITLSAIFARILPEGFFLPVTPGTAEVTLGGAIANDVHGKNHHKRGTFGAHVEALTLRRSDGEVLACSRHENTQLFAATIGGMGLTGLVLYARIRLMRVASPDIRQRTIRFTHIDDYFARIDAIDAAHEYSVAWIDQLATGKRLGRGILMAGDHAQEHLGKTTSRRLAVPFAPPVNLLNRLTLTAFNEACFRKAPKRETVQTVPWRKFFHPLDSIANWNRLYGPRGLFQHQSVYPAANASETTARLLECARAHGHASFLTVLKRFGDVPSPGLFSFPRPGFTLTLDFANQGPATLKLLDALDEIVVSAGGAVNPYKDARMSAETFAASFPDWRSLEAMRDPAMMSDLWSRTAMRLRPETKHLRPDSPDSFAFDRFPSPAVSASAARNPATKDAAR